MGSDPEEGCWRQTKLSDPPGGTLQGVSIKSHILVNRNGFWVLAGGLGCSIRERTEGEKYRDKVLIHNTTSTVTYPYLKQFHLANSFLYCTYSYTFVVSLAAAEVETIHQDQDPFLYS